MKILYFITTLPENHNSTIGMGGNCWLDFFEEMSKNNKVTVITPLLHKKQKNYKKEGNLEIIRVSPVKPSFSLENTTSISRKLKTMIMLLNMWKKAVKLNKKEKFEVIHGLWIIPNGLIAALSNIKAKKVVTSPGSDLHTWSYKPIIKSLIKLAIKKTDYCTGVSEQLCERAKELGAKKVECVPVPTNSGIFKLHKKIEEPHSILFSGRLTWKKGIFILIESINLIKKEIPDIKLYICGDGPDKDKIIKKIKENKLQKNIEVIINAKRNELIEITNKCKCLVLPSYNEGLPASVLESMFIGRPVIVTDVGDLKKIVNKDSGEIIDKNNPKELKKAIIKVLNKKYNPDKIRKSAMQADTGNVVKKYIEIYKKIKKN